MTERLIDPGGKILRHPDVLSAIRRGEPVWPLNVELDLSNACNLSCRWCDFAYTHDGAILQPEVAVRILRELAEGGTKAITLTGGGEPTCSPHFAEVARQASDLGLLLGLYTNGVNIGSLLDVLDLFCWVYISLDATDETTYRTAKGVPAFERVCRNVQRLALARHQSKTVLGVGYLVDATNWLRAGTAVALARRLGADYCQLRPVVQGDPEADYGWISKALPYLETLAGPGVYLSRERFVELRERRERGYTDCRGSALVPCIGATGDLWVCPNTRGKRKLGNLQEETFAVLWARREQQSVGPDCRRACRNHALNVTLEYVTGEGPHDEFV